MATPEKLRTQGFLQNLFSIDTKSNLQDGTRKAERRARIEATTLREGPLPLRADGATLQVKSRHWTTNLVPLLTMPGLGGDQGGNLDASARISSGRHALAALLELMGIVLVIASLFVPGQQLLVGALGAFLMLAGLAVISR